MNMKESVDLVYVDPPFFTQKTHSLTTRDRTTKFEFSDEWGSRTEYQILQRRRRNEHGKSVYARNDDGQVVNDGHKNGVPISDVWDIREIQ